MAFNQKDIDLQKRLLASYEKEEQAALLAKLASEDHYRRVGQAVRATKEILRAAGVDV